MLNSAVTPLTALARRGDLAVRATAAWPESDEDSLSPLAGFIESTFSPLVAEVAERCLRRGYGPPPLDAGLGERVAIVVMSPLGDVVSATRVARAVDLGDRVGPLLFFQSVPHAVAGHVAARWGLGGPIVALSSATAGLDVAALLIDDGDADAALVILAEQRRTGDDRAAAVLVTGPIPAQVGS
jgi:hypothetical protein